MYSKMFYTRYLVFQVEELPFLLMKCGDRDRLKETVTDLEVFARLVKSEEGTYELIKAWKFVSMSVTYLYCAELWLFYFCNNI